MDFSTLEKAWRKQTVTGGQERAEIVIARMKREVAIAQRRIRGGIFLATFVLFTGWTVSITAHLTSIKQFTPVAIAADTVNFIFLIAFFIRAFRSARAVQSEMKMMGGTLLESVSATLRTLDVQFANARIAGYAIPIVATVNAWLFAAKYHAGELPAFGAIMGCAFMAAFGAVIGTIIWYRNRAHLSPRRKELMEMMHALGQSDAV